MSAVKFCFFFILGLMVVSAFAFLNACNRINIPPIGKIKLVSVDVLSGENIRDPGYALTYASTGRSESPMVRVTFSAPDDYQSIALRWHYGGAANLVGLCKENSVDLSHELVGFADVYDHVAMVDNNRPAAYGLSRNGDAKQISYHFYFDPRWVYPYHWHNDRLYSYDLTKNPADVCLQIVASRVGLPIGFATNVVRIPREELMAAFSRAHLRCLDSGVACQQTR